MPPHLAQRLQRQRALLVVLAVLLAGVVYLFFQPGHWRRGSSVIAAALILAALLRAVLPKRSVGALAVRSRWFDVGFLLVLGAGILTVLAELA